MTADAALANQGAPEMPVGAVKPAGEKHRVASRGLTLLGGGGGADAGICVDGLCTVPVAEDAQERPQG